MATNGVVNWSQTAASNNTADSGVNWQEGQAPSTVNDSARGMMAAVAKWRDDISGSLTTSGTSTAYTLTTNQDVGSLGVLDNKELSFTVHTTSGATPTLNVDGLGAKNIRHATGATLPTGALISGSVYRVKYNNAGSEFLLMNQIAVLPDNLVTTAALAASSVTYAKIQNVAASKLLGNPTGSSAAPSEITIGSDLSFSGSTLNPKVGPTSLVGYLSGLELSTAGSSAIFGIAVGAANDVAQADMIVLSSAYTKTTSAWAVGSGNGALDTGAIANNTWYHVFLIKRSDTGVVDVLVSTSASAPTMPASYDRKRRIGSLRTNGSAQWTKFSQVGDEFIWDTATTDSGTFGTSRGNLTVTVPTGIVVKMFGRASYAGGGTSSVIITSLLESDQSPGGSPPNADITQKSAASNELMNVERWTNTSAQIGVRSTNVGSTVTVYTYGWRDLRGK